MKGIIIENDYRPDIFLRGFIADNPDAFEVIEAITYADQKEPREILTEIQEYDAIIVASTFRDVYQVEDFLDLLIKSNCSPKKLYIRYAAMYMNNWKKAAVYLRQRPLFDKVEILLERGFELYELGTRYSEPVVHDEYVSYMEKDIGRHQIGIFKVLKDSETQEYYTNK